MKERFFHTIFLFAILVGIFSLVILFVDIISDGYKFLSWDFFTSYASRKAENSGILAPLAGTLWLVFMTAILTIPIGVSTALYLEEFASDNLFNKIIKINVSNLAGVPSIIYGLLGLAFFTYTLSLGKSLLAGALTMTLLVLPIVIIASLILLSCIPFSRLAYSLLNSLLYTFIVT